MGLVESFVGVVPAGGGCKETLYRWAENLGDDRKAAWKSFMNIGLGRRANSPQEANALSMRRPNDIFHMNRDRILNSALSSIDKTSKAKARKPLALSGAEHFEEMLEWLTTEWDFASWSDSTVDSAIMGTVDDCVEQLQAQIDVGVQKLIFVPYKYETEQVEAIANEIIPRLRNGR
jgi:alkanesulfonate monooxygenase SsuD/methylene tetrahydromethanopterin reductase-like flavin-dependent oxidoreductase (luciferase family)